MTQKAKDQKVNRVEPVKEILQLPSTFTVIEPDGNESEWGDCFPGNRNSAKDSLKFAVQPERLQNNDQKDSFIIVIGMQKGGQPQSTCRYGNLHEQVKIIPKSGDGLAVFKYGHSHHNKQSDQ